MLLQRLRVATALTAALRRAGVLGRGDRAAPWPTAARYASHSAEPLSPAAAPSASAPAPASAAAPPGATWASLGVPSHLLGKLQQLRGVGAPTAVQRAALPALLADLAAPPGDTVLHSETGSGKTLCYLLPVFARLASRDAPGAKLRAVVVTPTRELSLQVAAVAEQLAAVGAKKDPARAVRVSRVVGEVSAQQLHDLKAAPPHVLIGTPATLARVVGAHVNTGELQLLVLDEADELLRNHSVAHVRELVAAARRHGNRPGTLAVSATSSFGLQQFAAEHMRRSARVVDLTRGAMVTPAALRHFVVRPGRANAAFNAFTRLLAAARPACALVFCNSARSMEALEAFLRSRGVPCGLLGNAYANAQRARALEGVRTGRLRVLIATEMAARGLDLPRVSHVVNFDPPTSIREYVHRAGRAGRLSSLAAQGTVVTFVASDAEEDAMLDIARELGVGLQLMSFEAGEAVVGDVGPRTARSAAPPPREEMGGTGAGAGAGAGAGGAGAGAEAGAGAGAGAGAEATLDGGGGRAGATTTLLAPVLEGEERERHERTLRESRRVRGGRRGTAVGAGRRGAAVEAAKSALLASVA